MDADDRFDVVLLGFSAGSAEPPAVALKRVFGIDDAAASKVLASLPRTVQKNVPRVRAEYFRRALASIGAEVEVRDRDGNAIWPGEPLHALEAVASRELAAGVPARGQATIVQAARPAGVDGGEATFPSHAKTLLDEPAPLPPFAPIADEPATAPPPAPVAHEPAPEPPTAPAVDEPALPVKTTVLTATAVISAPRPVTPLQPAPVAPPRPVTAPEPRAAAAPRIDMRSFWASLGDALVVPFRGMAMYWLVGITIWSVVVGLLGALAGFFPMPVFGLIVSFLAQTSLVAFACDFYKVCMWVPTTGEDAVDQPPRLDPERILDTYVTSGLHLSFFSLLSMVPLIAWLLSQLSLTMLSDLDELTAFALHPVTWMLLLFPSIYWPIGVGLTALANNFAAIWNVPLALRALGRAPLENLAIVGIGWAVFSSSWLLLALFGASMGLPGFLLQSSGGLPLALSHGMMGALFGHLVRSRADLLD